MPEDEVQNIKQREEWDEVLDEDRHLIKELEELTGKLEQVFLSQKVSIEDFLKNHWLKRMRQGWNKRKPLTQKQKRELCQISVVLESDYESSCDLYDSDFDDEEEEEEDERGEQLGSINSSKVKVDRDEKKID
ncbi:hypothetical protein NW754_010930 [Fusarium falciforme]|nr:hypothetical protein NW754_010930 [Fusarium falciforme]